MAFVTIDDMVQYIGLRFGVSLTDEHFGRAVSSVQSAYRALHALHSWNYFTRRLMVQFQGVYETGTIAYDANSRTVTLSGGTWPSWAAYGHLVVDGDSQKYLAVRRKSDTELELYSPSAPSADIAAGTSYSLVHSRVPLPDDVAQLVSVYRNGRYLDTPVLQARDAESWSRLLLASVWPAALSIVRDHVRRRGIVLWAADLQSDAEYDIQYSVRGTLPSTALIYESGVGVVMTSGSDVVQMPSGEAKANWEQCALRVGNEAGQIPTSLHGRRNVDTGEFLVTTPAFESAIHSVDTGTDTVVTSESPLFDATAQDSFGYCVSHIIDVADGAMVNLLERLAILEFMQIGGYEQSDIEMAQRDVYRARVSAVEEDSIVKPSRDVPYAGRPRLEDFGEVSR